MKTILTILFITLLSQTTYSAQPAFHVMSGYLFSNEIKNTIGGDDLFIMPIAGISSHYIVDRFIGEAGIDYQIDIAVIRILVMWLIIPDSEKDRFLYCSFWSLLPDLIDKSLGTSYLHNPGESNLIKLTPGLTNLGEEFSILLFKANLE